MRPNRAPTDAPAVCPEIYCNEPAVVLAGSLSSFNLLEALELLALSSQSGVLRLTGTFTGRVYMSTGLITSAEAEGFESLGQALDGVVSEETAARMAFDHLMDVIFELLVLSEGDFEFIAGIPDPDGRRLGVEVQVVVAEWERRLLEWKQIAASVPPMSATLNLVARLESGIRDIVISRSEWQVLALLDGRRSVATAISLSGLLPVDACRVLYALVTKGLVDTTEA